MKISAFCRILIWSTCIPVILANESNLLNTEVDKAITKCRRYMQEAFTCWPPKRKINKYSFRLRQLFLNSIHQFSLGKCKKVGGRNRREGEIFTSTTMQTMTRHSMPEIARGDRFNNDRGLFGLDEMMNGNRLDFGFGAFGDRGESGGFMDFVEPGLQDDGDEIEGERGQLQFTDRIIGEDRKQIFKLERECEKSTKSILESRKFQNCPRINKWRQRLNHLLTDLTKMKNVCLKKDDIP